VEQHYFESGAVCARPRAQQLKNIVDAKKFSLRDLTRKFQRSGTGAPEKYGTGLA
jgi:hypothetical protein